MTTLIIALLILALVFAIKIQINVNNTDWKEKSINRPIILFLLYEE